MLQHIKSMNCIGLRDNGWYDTEIDQSNQWKEPITPIIPSFLQVNLNYKSSNMNSILNIIKNSSIFISLIYSIEMNNEFNEILM